MLPTLCPWLHPAVQVCCYSTSIFAIVCDVYVPTFPSMCQELSTCVTWLSSPPPCQLLFPNVLDLVLQCLFCEWHIGTLETVLYREIILEREVILYMRWNNALKYYSSMWCDQCPSYIGSPLLGVSAGILPIFWQLILDSKIATNTDSASSFILL